MAQQNTIQSSFIEQQLECPVCMELMVNVWIYQCKGGHNICLSCQEKLIPQICPECRQEYVGTRNFALEQLAAEYEKGNDNSESNRANVRKPRGARNDKQKRNFENQRKPNVSKAPYQRAQGTRNPPAQSSSTVTKNLFPFGGSTNANETIRCCLTTEECNNATISFDGYLEHLFLIHKVHVADENQTMSGSYVKRSEFRSNKYVRAGPSRLFIMHYAGRQFVITADAHEDKVRIWAALHGTQNEAKEFKCGISILGPNKSQIDRWLNRSVHITSMTSQQVYATGNYCEILNSILSQCLITENTHKNWYIKLNLSKTATIKQTTQNPTTNNTNNVSEPRRYQAPTLPAKRQVSVSTTKVSVAGNKVTISVPIGAQRPSVTQSGRGATVRVSAQGPTSISQISSSSTTKIPLNIQTQYARGTTGQFSNPLPPRSQISSSSTSQAPIRSQLPSASQRPSFSQGQASTRPSASYQGSGTQRSNIIFDTRRPTSPSAFTCSPVTTTTFTQCQSSRTQATTQITSTSSTSSNAYNPSGLHRNINSTTNRTTPEIFPKYVKSPEKKSCAVM